MRQRSLAIVRSCQRVWHREPSGCLRSCSTDRSHVEFNVFRDTVRHMPEGQKLTAGNLIEFRKHRDLVLGVIKGQYQQKWIVCEQDGDTHHVRGQDISLVLPGSHYTYKDITFFVENAKGVNAGCVEVTWQTMNTTSRPLTLAEMANLLLKDDSPMGLYTTYALLKTDRRYFRQISRNPPLYFRMSPGEVQMLRQSEDRRFESQEAQLAFKKAISEVLEKKRKERPEGVYWTEGEHQERIKALKEFALSEGPTLAKRTLAMESLRICGLSLTPNGAVRLLESLKVLDRHEPIALLRAGIQIDFPENVVAAAEEAASGQIPDRDAEIRRDLTHLKVFSIDELGTREIDDAIGVESLPNGQRKVWIHVSDPTRWVDLDSVLDTEARRRVVSLYIPTGTVPVFPWKVAEGCFSLKKQTQRCALSFGVILNQEGGIQQYDVVPSIICPSFSYSYDKADVVIEEKTDEDLVTLMEISNLRKAWRKKKGAVEIDLPECRVKVNMSKMKEEDDDEDEDPEVMIARRDHSSGSRSMIQEFMILAGEVAGKLGVRHSLALPYRSQARAILPKPTELNKLPMGPCRAAALRSRMTRGTTSSTQADPHASLGVDVYVQVTSPIRRYSDFLAHLQIKAHLRNANPPLVSTDLESLLVLTTQISRMRAKAADGCVNYWLAYYLKEHQKDSIWNATMLFWSKQSGGMASVLVDDLGLECTMRIDRPIKPGDKLRLVVAGVDVQSGVFRFEEVDERKSYDQTADAK